MKGEHPADRVFRRDASGGTGKASGSAGKWHWAESRAFYAPATCSPSVSLMNDEDDRGLQASMVPPRARCQAAGCRKRWAEFDRAREERG